MARRKGWKIRRSGFRVGNLESTAQLSLRVCAGFWQECACVHVDKNSYGYDPVICATIYFGMLVVYVPENLLREYSFSLVVLFSDHLSSP